MADESVRSLLATLGFEVDNTGADQFEARFKKLKSTVGTLAKKIEDFKFDPKPKIAKSAKRFRRFGKRLKKVFLEGLKLKPGGFDPKPKTAKSAKKFRRFGRRLKKAFFEGIKIKPGGFDSFSSSIKKGLRKSLKSARLTALAGAAALATIVGKGLLKFTDVQSAKFALRFQAENLGVDFDSILNKLKDVKKETGNVVDELDLLQALNVGFQLTGNFESVAKNMGSVIKFASILNKDLSEVQQQFSNFILTGENLAELKKFGFFDQEQIEALKKAGTGFGITAERDRTRILDQKIAEQVNRLDKKFKEFSGTNAAFISKMKVLGSEGLVKIGKGVTEDLRKAAEFFGVTTETPRNLSEKIKLPSRTINFEDLQRFTPPGRGGPQPQNNTVNQTNTVNINGGDTEMVRKVVGEVIKDAAQIEIRKNIDKGLPLVAQ